MKISEKLVIVGVYFALGLSAHADTPQYKKINCVDANSAAKAPLYLDIDATVHTDRIRLEVGNVITETYSGGSFQYRTATVYGRVDESTTQEENWVIKGSFGTVLVLSPASNRGEVTAGVKFDPTTGSDVYADVTNYPVTCKVVN